MTDTITEKLNAKFTGALKNQAEFKDESTINGAAGEFHDVALFLRDDEEAQFNLLVVV